MKFRLLSVGLESTIATVVEARPGKKIGRRDTINPGLALPDIGVGVGNVIAIAKETIAEALRIREDRKNVTGIGDRSLQICFSVMRIIGWLRVCGGLF